mgnify:CR=1 FL=1
MILHQLCHPKIILHVTIFMRCLIFSKSAWQIYKFTWRIHRLWQFYPSECESVTDWNIIFIIHLYSDREKYLVLHKYLTLQFLDKDNCDKIIDILLQNWQQRFALCDGFTVLTHLTYRWIRHYFVRNSG